VLVDALQQVRGDAGVDRAVEGAGHDVDGRVAVHGFMEREGGLRIKSGVTTSSGTDQIVHSTMQGLKDN
jgi:hypothetical protein